MSFQRSDIPDKAVCVGTGDYMLFDAKYEEVTFPPIGQPTHNYDREDGKWSTEDHLRVIESTAVEEPVTATSFEEIQTILEKKGLYVITNDVILTKEAKTTIVKIVIDPTDITDSTFKELMTGKSGVSIVSVEV